MAPIVHSWLWQGQEKLLQKADLPFFKEINESALDQQSISSKIASLILCVEAALCEIQSHSYNACNGLAAILFH